MEKNNTILKLEMGALITVLYAILTIVSNQYMFVPQVVGLRLMNALPIGCGLLFGRMGAFGCALGTLFGDVATGNLSPVSLGGFLGAYAAAYVPYRIWQGLKSDREENIMLGSPRTNMMFGILALTSAVPPTIIIPIFGDKMGYAPYVRSFLYLAGQNILVSVLLGSLLYKYVASRFLVGVNRDLWLAVKDHKTSTRNLSVALLRLTLTGLFIGLGFCAVMGQGMGQEVVIYTMVALAAVILLLANW